MSLKAEKVLMDFLFVLHEIIFIQANNITLSSDDEIEIENKYLGMQVDKLWVVLNIYWPESSALGNVADFWLATLPMALPLKNLCLNLPNSVRNAKTFLEAMPLAMLPTKSLQHCQDQMIRANMCKLLGPFLILQYITQTLSFDHPNT